MSGESMKNKDATLNLCCLLCNVLTQPHFEYACSAWNPNRYKKLKNKTQTSQNKCIPVYSWTKCQIYLKNNLKQLIGCPLMKDIISA